MKEMWTGIYPNKKEYKYEIRFRTDDEHAYKFVEEACRNAIDVDWSDEMPDLDKEEHKEENSQKFRWLSLDGNLFDISEERIVEYQCPKCGKEYLFKIDEMDWDDCGCFSCSCGRKVSYEKI